MHENNIHSYKYSQFKLENNTKKKKLTNIKKKKYLKHKAV